jgi:hypothetical protein
MYDWIAAAWNQVESGNLVERIAIMVASGRALTTYPGIGVIPP